MKPWEEIFQDWIDQTDGVPDFAALDAWLAADPANAKLYAEQVLLHCELSRRHWNADRNVPFAPRPGMILSEAGAPSTDDCCLEDCVSSASAALSTRRVGTMMNWQFASRYRSGFVGVVCLAVLLITAWAMLWNSSGSEESAIGQPKVIAETRTSSGRVTQSFNTHWSHQAQRWSVGDVVREGDVIQLEAGQIGLSFESGTSMTLVGPAELEIHSVSRVSLRHGIAATRVETEEGRGFRVLTPTTDVVDLGTEFGIRVDPSGETDLVVVEGAVDFTPTSQRGESPSAPQRLFIGEGARILKSGQWERISSIQSGVYPFGNVITSPRSSRPPVIVGVTDDVRSPKSAKFYHICHEGLDEDAQAFVDRKFQWNGVTKEGLPYFLRGADYIKTFNSDKLRNRTITVDLAGPAMLYVFLDDRVPVPGWLSQSFENTGYQIGIDENVIPEMSYLEVQTGVIELLGIGPGVSVDRTCSVWRRRVDQGGKVILKALPRERVNVNIPTEWRTMYGIAAQPL
ncbi:FecR domain-containing protein [Planctomicrobium sp. SH664]|uniref:FecR domain-containing protein n=1 Tax=Planctomicrobium sp. SH664 TaxID=3448125 RepID=UPI003F5B3175